MIRNVLVDGVDRLGKDTLIEGLQQTLGFFQVIHYQKPKLLKCFEPLGYHAAVARASKSTGDALFRYQRASFRQMFRMLIGPGNYIMNRTHLGEYVYAPRYRDYSGKYVFGLEEEAAPLDESLLLLLYTDNFDFIVDDGLSLDFSKRAEEQEDFKEAFKLSSMKNKFMINVHDGAGKFRPAQEILDEVVQTYVTL
jgi:hypothetical protein